MYGIRSKETGCFLRLVNSDHSHVYGYELGFSNAIELNYYVNESLGFISEVLLRKSNGMFYSPVLARDIDQNTLEVVNLKNNDIVSIEELLDGLDEDELPSFKSIKLGRIALEDIKTNTCPKNNT